MVSDELSNSMEDIREKENKRERERDIELSKERARFGLAE